jgi:hypothetical protein
MNKILEVWADTGVIVERDRTPSEQAQHEADQKAAAAAAKLATAQAAAAQAAKSAAIAHAKSLGFTDDMIAVMYPNLAPSAP